MKKIIILIMFCTIGFAQSNFKIGINSGLAWQYQEDTKPGYTHNLQLGYLLNDNFELYVSGGILSYSKWRSDFLDTYVTNLSFGIRYYLGNNISRLFVLGEVQQSMGDHIYNIEDVNMYKPGNYFKSVSRDVDETIAILGCGYSYQINKNFEFISSLSITIVSSEDDDLHYLRLFTGLNYRF
ncbi:MAG: hypothetical protein ACEPO8_15215 [Rhodothermaceae bacterium]